MYVWLIISAVLRTILLGILVTMFLNGIAVTFSTKVENTRIQPSTYFRWLGVGVALFYVLQFCLPV